MIVRSDSKNESLPLPGRLGVLAVATAALVALSAPASAQYYEGKTITILSGYSPGSSVTIGGRALANVLKQKLPGNPNVVVKVMTGGGGIKAQNFFSEKSKKDGLTLYYGPLGVVGKTLGRAEIRAEYDKFAFIGGFGISLITYGRTDVFETYDPKRGVIKQKSKIRIGGSRPMSNLSVIHRLAFDLLGLNYSYVPGFRGADKSLRALLQQEIHSYTGPEDTYINLIVPNLVKAGKGAGFFQYARMDVSGKPIKGKTVSGVPYFRDVYKSFKGKELTGPRWETMKWISTFLSNLVYTLYAPPGTDPKIVATLRDGHARTMVDPEYLKFHVKRFGGKPALTGVKVAENFLATFANADPTVVKVLKEFQAKVRKRKK